MLHVYALAIICQVKKKRPFEKYFGTTHDIAMLAIDPPICRRQRRLQCDLQYLLETRLRTDLWYSACYFYLQNNYVKAIANWSMALAVSSECSEHILLAQECVKASLAMLTNTSHLSWRADLVILEENICETTVLKFLLERDPKYDCCN